MTLTKAAKERLIVFTRYPEAGQAKTRLIPALGAEGAAALHRQMAEHTLTQVRKLRSNRRLCVEVCFRGDKEQSKIRDWLGSDLVYQPQSNGELGSRMVQALSGAFHDGMESVVIIGTDCPGLNADLMGKAFHQLRSHDLVFGPAIDGGYYLIGLRCFIPELFFGISWGTPEVLQQTVAIAKKLDLSIGYLPRLADVDRPEDLPVWEQIQRESGSNSDAFMPPASVDSRKVQSENFVHTEVRNHNSSTEKISIIIPVLNEVGTIKETLASTYPSTNVEAIAVDGGSTDGTVRLVQSLGVKVLSAPAGRACQMNAGAMAATGEILLFLHADTRLPPGFDRMVRTALQPSMQGDRQAPVAGAFALQIDAALRRLRLIEWGVNWRTRFLQMPYGDQAIFLKAETFHQMGGFPELPIMEDFELIRRLKRTGRIALIPTPVVTSARRWLKKGVCQTTLINQMVILAYLLNVPPKQLVRWYLHQPKLTPNHWFRSTPDPKSASINPLSTEAGEETRSSQREIVHPDWV